MTTIDDAIERHRRAVANYSAVIGKQAELERSIPWERRQSIAMRTDPNDDPRWQDCCNLYQAVLAELNRSADDLCMVRPSSIADLVALCEYVRGRIEEWELPNDFHKEFVTSLPDMLKGLDSTPIAPGE